MRVVRSQPISNRVKVYQRDLILALLQGGAGLLLLILLLLGLLSGAGPAFWIALVIGLGLVAGGLWFGMAVLNYWQKSHVQERIGEILTQNLGDEFIYFRNLTLPGQRSVGEIDGVLLGPPGAIVMQVEAGSGEYAVEGDTWYRYGRGKSNKPTPKPLSQLQPGPALIEPRRRLDDSPTWAVIRAAREVKAWLSVRGLPQVIVQPIVVLGSGHIHNLKRPSAPVVELAGLGEYLVNHFAAKPLPIEGEPLAVVVVEQIAQRLQTNGD